jgi:hypothetical protein
MEHPKIVAPPMVQYHVLLMQIDLLHREKGKKEEDGQHDHSLMILLPISS